MQLSQTNLRRTFDEPAPRSEATANASATSPASNVCGELGRHGTGRQVAHLDHDATAAHCREDTAQEIPPYSTSMITEPAGQTLKRPARPNAAARIRGSNVVSS